METSLHVSLSKQSILDKNMYICSPHHYLNAMIFHKQHIVPKYFSTIILSDAISRFSRSSFRIKVSFRGFFFFGCTLPVYSRPPDNSRHTAQSDDRSSFLKQSPINHRIILLIFPKGNIIPGSHAMVNINIRY